VYVVQQKERLAVRKVNRLNDSLKLIVQPIDEEAHLALYQLGFQKVPIVPQLLYCKIDEAQVSELFLKIGHYLPEERQILSRFILTRSSLDSKTFLVEFLNAQSLRELTLLIEHTWFLQVLTQQGLFFNFQPIVHLASKRVVAHECLARAQGTKGEEFSGQQLIDAALQMHMTHEFDDLARSACLDALGKVCARLDGAETKPTFFINVLPNAIAQNPNSLEKNFQQVLDLGLRPEQIVFELTEVEALGDYPELPRLIQQIREWGFGLALDDLGSNVSIDHYCTAFRPDVIKLDRRLIHECSRYVLKQVMVKSLLQFAHELGIIVLAEGLELPEDIQFCQDIGVDLGQGFGLGMPKLAPWDKSPQLKQRIAC
jgi:EAL domain-containing protein (putative c-di-GMP-specific phosphodiesterase class I)